MENITFYEQINLFLERKRPKKPSAYVHRQALAYAGLMHVYAGMDLRMHLRFQKPMKCKFSYCWGLERISHRLGTIPNPYFLTI